MKNSDVIVITEDNLNEVIERVKALQGGQFVVYGLDLKSFENLAINMEQIKRYIEQQNEVILYYEKAVKEEPKIVEEDLDEIKEVFQHSYHTNQQSKVLHKERNLSLQL